MKNFIKLVISFVTATTLITGWIGLVYFFPPVAVSIAFSLLISVFILGGTATIYSILTSDSSSSR